ncbi:unnamed protein product [Closterium sp. Naga37s-1]|nr:unnamed protein product [Closterium sp. Naga37s-1]
MRPKPSPGTPPNCIGARHFPPIAATTPRVPPSPIPRCSAFHPHHLAIVAAAAGEKSPLLCARGGNASPASVPASASALPICSASPVSPVSSAPSPVTRGCLLGGGNVSAGAGGTGSIIGGKDETGGADETGGEDDTGGEVDTGTAAFETGEEVGSGMRSGEGCPMGKEQLRLRGG